CRAWAGGRERRAVGIKHRAGSAAGRTVIAGKRESFPLVESRAKNSESGVAAEASAAVGVRPAALGLGSEEQAKLPNAVAEPPDRCLQSFHRMTGIDRHRLCRTRDLPELERRNVAGRDPRGVRPLGYVDRAKGIVMSRADRFAFFAPDGVAEQEMDLPAMFVAPTQGGS